MTTVITIANQKGGTGKSAIAVNLAAGLSLHQHRVLLVDADPQKSAVNWFGRRLPTSQVPFEVKDGALADLDAHVDRVVTARTYDYIVIDCPAGQSTVTRAALLAADHILVPMMPSLCDFNAAEEFVPLLRDAAIVRRRPRIHMVISRKLAGRSKESLEARTAAERVFCSDFPINVLETEIYERRAELVRAYTMSITVFEQKGWRSAVEFADLTREIEALQTA